MIKRWQNIILDCFRIVSAFNCTVHSAQWTLSQRPSVIVHLSRRPYLSSSTISVSSLAPSFLNRRRQRQRSMFQNASLTQWLNASLRQCPVFTFLVRRNAVFVSLVDSQRAQSMLNRCSIHRTMSVNVSTLQYFIFIFIFIECVQSRNDVRRCGTVTHLLGITMVDTAYWIVIGTWWCWREGEGEREWG
jgi:hypothetical protein